MKKRVFVKAVKIWMKRNNLKRKSIYIHDGGDLFLHWKLQSKKDGKFIDLTARKDLDPFDNECIILTIRGMKKLGENICVISAQCVMMVVNFMVFKHKVI